MRFDWDEAKNRANLRKHGFHFAGCRRNVRWTVPGPPRYSRGLRRRALDRCCRVAFVAFSVESHETIRIISLSKATNEERQDYETAIDDGLEAH
jgi:uncharacterized DUF497 family protein